MMLKWVCLTFFCTSSAFGAFLFGKSDHLSQQYAEREAELKKSIDEYRLKAQGKIQSVCVEKEAECSSNCLAMVRRTENLLEKSEQKLLELQRAYAQKKQELHALEQSVEHLNDHLSGFDNNEVIVFKVCDDVYELDFDMLMHPCVCFSALQVMLLNTKFNIPRDEENRILVSRRIIDKKLFKWIYQYILNEGFLENIDELSLETARVLYRRSDYYGLVGLMNTLEAEFGTYIFSAEREVFHVEDQSLSAQNALLVQDVGGWLNSLDKKEIFRCIKAMFIDAVVKDRIEKRGVLRKSRTQQLLFQRFWMLSLRCWLYGALKSLEKTNPLDRQMSGDIVQTLEWYTLGFGMRKGHSSIAYHPCDEKQYDQQRSLLKTSQILSLQSYPMIEKQLILAFKNHLYHKSIDKYRMLPKSSEAINENICFRRESCEKHCITCQRSLNLPSVYLSAVQEKESELLKLWNEIRNMIQASLPNYEF